ncbi:hypothetical protein J2741_001696 [Methanolinea mesophila]|uniref:DNA N-6-adenine-methyltransferase n=1 Tax=Methanolinea mesophila TaxID=547055 RepID=UPI001AEB5704|nr:DNA N-6-adenine-methyltransferase [Methanolinea mesophila]MBP1929149.1 hypothetical protein [Methanolinea mesophila]
MTLPTTFPTRCCDDHLTPRYILDAAIACMGGIDLDPCSNSRTCPNVPAARQFTREDDGLAQPWDGRVFLNPPFGREVERWFAKLAGEYCTGRTTAAIVLWKSATETKAWQVLTGVACQVCFPSRRIDLDGAGNLSGSTFSPAIFYLGIERARFMLAFEGLGPVWEVPGGCRNGRR